MRSSETLRNIAEGIRGGHPPQFGVPGALGIPAPEGNPDLIGEAAANFRGSANMLDRAAEDLDTLRRERLPEVWDTQHGSEAAKTRMRTTARHAEGVSDVFGRVSRTLGQLGLHIRIAQRRDNDAREQLQEAYGRYQRTDPDEADGVVGWMAILVGQMADAAELAENAGIDAAGLLNDYAGQAIAGQLEIPWMHAADLIALVNAAEDDLGPILTASDAERAAAALAGLSPEDQTRFAGLLAAAGSEAEQAWLLKGLAAGNDLDALAGFADTIRGRGDDWLQEHLRPLDPARVDSQTNRLMWNGAELKQASGTTCGSMSMLLAQAMYDPVFALNMVWDPSLNNGAGGVVSDTVMQQRLAEEEDRIKGETSQWRWGMPPKWPGGLGTHPSHAVDYLNEHTPVEYEVSWDTAGSAGVMDNVADSVAGASAGEPALLVIGNNTYPDHYVMVVGQDDNGNILVYDPARAQVTPIPPENLHQQPLDELNRDSLYAVVTPAG